MKKPSRLIRLLSITVSLLLAASMLSSCGLVSLILPFVAGANTELSGPKNFNSLVYEQPDFDAILDAFEEALDSIQDGGNTFFIQLELSEAYELYNDAYTQYNLLQIHYSIDTRDQELSEEIAYCTERFSEIDPLLNEVYLAIVDADMEDTLLPDWTEADFEALRIKSTLYDEEYSELITQRTELENAYTELTTSITIDYQGVAYTVDQAVVSYQSGKLTQEQYRHIIISYYQKLNTEGAKIYFDLMEIDNQLYGKLELDSIADYYYSYYYERDYAAQDAQNLHALVKTYVVPLYKQLSAEMDYEVLSSALYKINDPLSEYDSIIREYAEDMSPHMKEALDMMEKYDLLYAGNKEGMQMAGYTTYLPSYEMPFIYLYTNEDLDDVTSFVHEFGHFYSYAYNGFETDGVLDVSEIQSQANEWLFAPYYDLSDSEREQYLIYRLSETLATIIEGALYDEFQQEMYGRENISLSGANALFMELADEYELDYIYNEELIPYLWTAVHHNFIAPFYYISYAVSALPALAIYYESIEDRENAIDIYLNVCNETGYRSYSEVLADNDLPSPFSSDAYSILEDLIRTFD